MPQSVYEVHQRTVETWAQALLDRLSAVERELWILVVTAMLADLWLTQRGLRQGLYEANPVVRSLVTQYGTAALPVLKTAALGVGGATRELVPERTAPVVPLGLALPWVVAVAINALLLSTL
jgi:hypothetical protein